MEEIIVTFYIIMDIWLFLDFYIDSESIIWIPLVTVSESHLCLSHINWTKQKQKCGINNIYKPDYN